MGFFSDLVDGFTGKAQKDAAVDSHRAYSNALNRGVAQARPEFEQGYGNAMEAYQPLADQGQEYNALLANLYGLNGADEQGEAQNAFMQDPMRQGQLSMAVRGADRGANASGLWGSGRQALAGERAAQGVYDNWLAGVGNQAARGAGYIGNRAMLDVEQGNTIGNMLYGTEAAKGQSAAGMNQAIGQSKSVFGNNLMGIAGLGVKAATGGLFGGSRK